MIEEHSSAALDACLVYYFPLNYFEKIWKSNLEIHHLIPCHLILNNF